MPEGADHSLWFVPQGETLIKLEGIIKDLAKRYTAPVFVPHMTLIPDVVGSRAEVLKKMQSIAVGISPFQIRIIEMGYVTGSLYQGLYAKAQMSPELQGAVDLARSVFGRVSDPPFKPHISVAYKEDLPDWEKEKLVPGLVAAVRGLTFTADHIEAWTNGLPIEGWRKAGEADLL